jgi:hypothetical protein
MPSKRSSRTKSVSVSTITRMLDRIVRSPSQLRNRGVSRAGQCTVHWWSRPIGPRVCLLKRRTAWGG